MSFFGTGAAASAPRAGKEPERSYGFIEYNCDLGVQSSLMNLDLLDRRVNSSLSSPGLLPPTKIY